MGKTERLKSRKVIDGLFIKGKSFSIFPFRVVYSFINAGEQSTPHTLKAGFSASKKHFKKAVDRNRIKRLMRETYRLQKQPLQQLLTGERKTLALFILFTGKELPEHQLVHEKMLLIIQKLQRLSNEKLAANS